MAEDNSVETEVAVPQKLILYVEDNPDLRDLGKVIMERAGYQVVTAEDYDKADEILKDPNQVKPDAVVTDFELGEGKKNGSDVCKLAYQNNIPAILATSHADNFKEQHTPEQLRKAGIYDAVQKPFRAATLTSSIATLFETLKAEKDA